MRKDPFAQGSKRDSLLSDLLGWDQVKMVVGILPRLNWIFLVGDEVNWNGAGNKTKWGDTGPTGGEVKGQ